MDTSAIESVEIAIFAAQLTDLLAGTVREGTSEEMRDLARGCLTDVRLRAELDTALTD